MYGNEYFIAGGSLRLGSLTVFSKQAQLIDISTGIIEELPDMLEARQAHGMSKVRDYVYCCGGYNGDDVLTSCERFSLANKSWAKDVPELKAPRLAMTMLVINYSWVYLFGGCTDVPQDQSTNFLIERIDTNLIGRGQG